MVTSPGITEFYSIKLKYPMTDDDQRVVMHISPQQDLESENQTTKSAESQEGAVWQIPGNQAPQKPNLYVYPERVVFSKKCQAAHVSV